MLFYYSAFGERIGNAHPRPGAEIRVPKLATITLVLQKASLGDFSEKIEIPEEEDEFTEHLVALNLMVDDLKELTYGLEGQVKARTQELQNKLVELERLQKFLAKTRQEIG